MTSPSGHPDIGIIPRCHNPRLFAICPKNYFISPDKSIDQNSSYCWRFCVVTYAVMQPAMTRLSWGHAGRMYLGREKWQGSETHATPETGISEMDIPVLSGPGSLFPRQPAVALHPGTVAGPNNRNYNLHEGYSILPLSPTLLHDASDSGLVAIAR